MPRREEDTSLPSRALGLPQGTEAGLGRFEQATAPSDTPPIESTAPVSGGGVAQRIGQRDDLVASILRPTERPDEPITFGLQQFEQEQADEVEIMREWLPVLEQIALLPDAPPSLIELLVRAQEAL